jgi:hypothetical protein
VQNKKMAEVNKDGQHLKFGKPPDSYKLQRDAKYGNNEKKPDYFCFKKAL